MLRGSVDIDAEPKIIHACLSNRDTLAAQYRLQGRFVDELRNVAGGEVPVTARSLTDAGSDPQP